MPLFSFGPKKIFTVDPGNHAIKIAQFSSQKGSFILEKFLSFPVPKESVREDGLFNKKSLSQPLLQFIKENIEGSGYKLRICISGKFTFIKKIEIPREEKKLMRELIHMEAKETLPFHLNEINYSYKILDHIQASQENKVNILLVSARKDAIHNYEDLFKKMGLRCELIDIGGVALANCVKFTEEENLSEDSSVLVVDIGKSGTELSVVNNGELIFSRYFTVGGDFYNNTLMSEMGINYEEAEHLKTKNPVEEKSHPEVHHLLSSGHEYFCDELSTRYEYFKKQFPQQKVQRCYVTGGGSQMKSLVEAIGKKINTSIQILNPLKKIKCDSLVHSIEQTKHFCSLNVGLCVRKG